jgi:DNA polymerase elongation subunit (family B)
MVRFQITDIVSDDFRIGKSGSTEFVITLYGIDTENEPIVCHVRGYRPYVYMKIPDWCKSVSETFVRSEIIGNSDTSDSMKSRVRNELTITHTCSKEFYGYHWDAVKQSVREFPFLKLSFKTHQSLKKCIRWIKDCYARGMDPDNSDYERLHERYGRWFRTEAMFTTAKCDCNLYESFIHPIVRFIHETNIEPTGWIETKDEDYPKTGLFEDPEFWCQKHSVKPVESMGVSQYKIASFDIECDSSHGDFPQTKKYYKKLATDIYDSCHCSYIHNLSEERWMNSLLKELPNVIFQMLRVSFGLKKGEFDCTGFKEHTEINTVYTIQNRKPTPASLKNISNKLCVPEIHTRVFSDEKTSGKQRDACIREIHTVISRNIVDSDGNKIEEAGDPIIQIGTVFHNYGTDYMKRHIIVCGPTEDTDITDVCDDLPNIEIVRCQTEKQLLKEWRKIINQENPDFITGYNIFGFDFRYLIERASFNFGKDSTYSMKSSFMNLGKIDNTHKDAQSHYSKKCQKVERELNSSALGENTFHYIQMDGRIIFDIQKEVMKGHQLESFKLDNVAAYFMRGTVVQIDGNILRTTVKTLKMGDYISFRTHSNIGEQLHESGRKYQITGVSTDSLTLSEPLIMIQEYQKIEWCLNKDDISPQDIFDKHKVVGSAGAKGRAEIAKYCIQDCELCINLLLLLDIIPNNLAMANVSYVPASYIFLRGQGVKVSSVVAKTGNLENTRIPDLRKSPFMRDYIKEMKKTSMLDCDSIRSDQLKSLEMRHNKAEQKNTDDQLKQRNVEYRARYSKKLQTWSKDELLKEVVKQSLIEDNSKFGKPPDWILDEWVDEAVSIHNGDKGMEGYEGAVVLDPEPGLYLDDPISVLDYASLYPNSIREMNISHETQVGRDFIVENGLDESDYNKIDYVNWVYRLKGKGNTVEKVKSEVEPSKTCYFLSQPYLKHTSGGSGQGIIPKVLEGILEARSDTKKLMKSEKDEMKYKVLDGLQLAYKVTANSVYGQLGARTSTIFNMALAACTTAVGRDRIKIASQGVKLWAHKKGYKEPAVIYGDTDSVFVKFSREVDGEILTGTDALEHCIQCGIEAGEYVTNGVLTHSDKTQTVDEPLLHNPQDLEYEKTFWPFILISKKRYTGNRFIYKPINPKRTSMGIVLKRRDNAPIVKYVFGHVIEMIMSEKDFDRVKHWLTKTLENIYNGTGFDDSYFVITKALRGYYKNPRQIAHKVLADRMAERDPGNKPKANDRIAYAYIKLDDTIEFDHSNPYKSGLRKGKARERSILQGDRIEHIDYIRKHSVPIDYGFYITNQIMNPVKQVLDLHMDPVESSQLFEPFHKQPPVAISPY